MKKLISLFLMLLFVSMVFKHVLLAQDQVKTPEQEITDFNLVGYGDKGKKSWQIEGKSADIFKEDVEIEDFEGQIFGQEDVNLSADKGNLNKDSGSMRLEGNVVATTASGAKLTTESLDWDQKGQTITTNETVNIERDNMKAQSQGAKASTALNKFYLHKDVQVEIKPEGKQESIAIGKNRLIINCDGPLEVAYENNEAVFNNNVVATSDEGTIYCDKLTITFSLNDKKEDDSEKNSKSDELGLFGAKSGNIDKVVAEGNVKIARGENVTFSDKAVYTSIDKKITLTGRPKLFLYTEGDSLSPAFGK